MQFSFAVISFALATMGAAVPTQSTVSVLPQGQGSNKPLCPAKYTVKRGDTCLKIATLYYSKRTVFETILQLEARNPGLNCYKESIYPGQKLCVPLKARCSKLHTVKMGEFCKSIAGKYGLSFANLKSKNLGLDCENPIPPARVLCVA